ncbi:uncharacterized protein si:dkey-29h14.10 [Neolamprologus brichardi]|uniref:uncharacterized protein si:dkey-29h14.10 n=1 Tax=Neolamprologus brichardi TaxID=32507 RepID=UPI001643BB8C|nr:uncharacterized protein si:dkey-29h14.10 [Neolamprologus brichardi]
MDSTDPLPLSPFINNSFAKTKEGSLLNQVMPSKTSTVATVIQVVQRVVQNSCIRACQLLCLPFDPVMCEKVTCCSAETHQPKENKNIQAMALQSPPSTILIVNISNSTLIDCVIGNGTRPVVECQPLMQETERHMKGQMRFSCYGGKQESAQDAALPPLLPSEEHPSISIHSSHVSYTIIGDNNSMHVDMSQPSN